MFDRFKRLVKLWKTDRQNERKKERGEKREREKCVFVSCVCVHVCARVTALGVKLRARSVTRTMPSSGPMTYLINYQVKVLAASSENLNSVSGAHTAGRELTVACCALMSTWTPEGHAQTYNSETRNLRAGYEALGSIPSAIKISRILIDMQYRVCIEIEKYLQCTWIYKASKSEVSRLNPFCEFVFISCNHIM